MPPTEKPPSPALVVAIPVANGQLCMHFGHCEQFALLDVNVSEKRILDSRRLDPPAHEPGVLPRWLHDQGVSLILAGGMGGRAQNIFAQHGIDVIVGVPSGPPDEIVQSYLDGEMQPGENICDH